MAAPEDLLDLTPKEIVTSEAPKVTLSSSDIEAPYKEMANALDKWASATNEVSTNLAKRAAESDLAQQRVTLDQNGNVQVLHPANSVMFGDAGRQYAEAVKTGTAMQAANVMSQQMTSLHQRNMMDPAGFQKGSDSFLDTFAQQYGGTPWGAPALEQGRRDQTAHLDHISNAAAMNDVENQKISIQNNIKESTDRLIGLARTGGTSTNEFVAEMTKYVSAERALEANPIFKTPTAEVDRNIHDTITRMQGESVVAHIDETLKKTDKATAQKELRAATLDNVDMADADRGRLYNMGMAHLEFLTADERAGFAANKQNLEAMRKGLAAGMSPDDPRVTNTRAAAVASHDAEAIKSYDDIMSSYRGFHALSEAPRGTVNAQSTSGVLHIGFFNDRAPGLNSAGLNPDFSSRLQQATLAAEAATGERASFTSLARSTEAQAHLYEEYLHGGGLAAPPGQSLHERGEAADLKAGKVLDWLHQHATEYGLTFLHGRAGAMDPGHIQIGQEGGGGGGALTASAMSAALLGQESGGNQNAPTSAGNAHGIGQIIPGTFAQYAKPGERIDNPADNLAVHQRIAADYMQRWPNDPARVAVAYFSGPNNVSPPGYSTPYLYNRSDANGKYVDSYVHDVMGRLGRPSTTIAQGQGGFNPNAFTKAQLSDPGMLNEIWRMSLSDPEEKISSFRAQTEAMQKNIDYGIQPPDGPMATIMQAGRNAPPGTPLNLLGAQAEGIKMSAIAMGGGGMQPMSAPQRQAYEQRLEDMMAGGDLHEQAALRSALQTMQDQDKREKAAPLATLAQRFHQPAPLPLDAPDALLQRGILSTHLGAINGTRATSIFDPGELAGFKSMLAQMPPDKKVATFSAISQIPESARNATLASLGSSGPQAMTEAMTGALTGEGQEGAALAQSIFRGMDAMKAEKRYNPEDEGNNSRVQYFTDRDAAFSPSIFPQQMRTDPNGPYAGMVGMINARYADLKAQTGNFAYDTKTLKQSVEDVTGGVLFHNGAPIIAPSRGMDQVTFDRTINSITDQTMAGAATQSGQPVTADYVKQNAQLESLGSGRYYVKLGRSDLAPVYAYGADGKKFVLDLTNVAPSGSGSPLYYQGLQQ